MYHMSARPTVEPEVDPLAWIDQYGNPMRYFPEKATVTADDLPNINNWVIAGCFKYKTVLWRPGMPVLSHEFLALDTETEYLIKGGPKRPVTLQVCDHVNQQIHIVWWTEIDEYIKLAFTQNPETRWIMHNAPFDLNIIGFMDEDKPYLLQAVLENRIIDTSIRFFLRQLEKGLYCPSTMLKDAVRSLLNEEMDKDVDIRCTFNQNEVPTKEHILYTPPSSSSSPCVPGTLRKLSRFTGPLRSMISATEASWWIRNTCV